MTLTFQLHVDELDERFLAAVKTAFKGREVEIVVGLADATEALSENPVNHERLLRAMEDIKAGRNLVTPDQRLFQD